MNKLVGFGLGFSALAFARSLARQGFAVAGTARSPDKAQALEREGFAMTLFDSAGPLEDAESVLAGGTHLLDSIPPARDSICPPLDWHSADIARMEHVAWIGYLSTTGVYGDHGGDWVDEATVPLPDLERSARRLEAEQNWLVMHERYGLPVHVFRLAGIYGPGRGVLEQIRSGRAKRIVKPGQVFSRIHVDDIVQVLEASMARPNPGAIYNVCDDEPEAPDRVVEYGCELLGIAPPEPVAFEDAELSDMARSFYADNKRVRNDRIRDELGVKLRYPSYREGLAASIG
ncbi:MAG: SDR family oxidoreductase [Proteobacteria bacterium]|nr:SDR family oxidoreductase [Pseudomonadota bacterium]